MTKYTATIALFLATIFLMMGCNQRKTTNTEQIVPPEFKANSVIPSDAMIEYQEMEFIGFIHFTINTFTNKEWGYGDESPTLFNPSELNTDQWAKVASEAGMKQLILTAKHHDGFCLWPSAFTEHSVKNSPYKNGEGDIVKDFVASCRKYGLKPGLYLSPWDRNHSEYGSEEYITYYRNQLKELLTNYGEINEIWFDGANGGDGYYGGSKEKREIDNKTYYDWDSTINLAKSLQPNIKIFSGQGPDVRWIGNEAGYAGETCWSTITTEKMVFEQGNFEYLNTGDPHGESWIVGQCDVSIRPGWFYHESQDSLIKSPEKLMDIYYKSIGRNAVLLLNLTPDQRGLIPSMDVDSLKKFKALMDQTFSKNIAKGLKVKANDYRGSHEKYKPENAIDDDRKTYWATNDSIFPAELILTSEKTLTFDRIMLQEPIEFGQRVSKFKIEVFENNKWTELASGTTIGYKRILRVKPRSTKKIKLSITETNNTVAISNFALFKSPE